MSLLLDARKKSQQAQSALDEGRAAQAPELSLEEHPDQMAPEAGMLEVRELRKPVARTAAKGNPPSPSVSMPYYFPSSGKESALVPYGKRSRRK